MYKSRWCWPVRLEDGLNRLGKYPSVINYDNLHRCFTVGFVPAGSLADFSELSGLESGYSTRILLKIGHSTASSAINIHLITNGRDLPINVALVCFSITDSQIMTLVPRCLFGASRAASDHPSYCYLHEIGSPDLTWSEYASTNWRGSFEIRYKSAAGSRTRSGFIDFFFGFFFRRGLHPVEAEKCAVKKFIVWEDDDDDLAFYDHFCEQGRLNGPSDLQR